MVRLTKLINFVISESPRNYGLDNILLYIENHVFQLKYMPNLLISIPILNHSPIPGNISSRLWPLLSSSGKYFPVLPLIYLITI